jgi:virginiamycin B lyase
MRASRVVTAVVLTLSFGETRAAKITEFPLPPGSSPQFIALGFDGNMWFSEYGTSKVAAITPSGIVFEYDTPTPGCRPRGMTLSSGSGQLFFTCTSIAKVGAIGPGPALIDFDVGAYFPVIPSGQIASGPDGRLWFPTSDGSIFVYTYQGALVTGYQPGLSYAVTAGGDGNTWFTMWNAGTVFRSRYLGGGNVDDHSYPLPTTSSGPLGIAWCPAWGRVWYAERNAGKLGYFNPAIDGAPHEITLPGGAASQPESVACGADRSVWYEASGTNKVGRVKFDLTIEEFSIPTPSSYPFGVAIGADGAIWFTEIDAGKIGRLQLRPGGDVNGDGIVDVSDVFFLINYLFAGGPLPVP